MRLLALPTLLLAVALAGCGSDSSSSGSSGGGQTIDVHLSEFVLDPSSVSVQKPGTYTFHAINDGRFVHALEIEGHGVEEETDDIQPGENADLTVELSAAGDYELYCPIDGHREKGMDGSVQVGGTAAGGGATTTNEDSGDDDGYGYGG
jgi:plastocyanin